MVDDRPPKLNLPRQSQKLKNEIQHASVYYCTKEYKKSVHREQNLVHLPIFIFLVSDVVTSGPGAIPVVSIPCRQLTTIQTNQRNGIP